MDIKAFFKLSYGLYVVTSNFESTDSGCIVNTFSQVTAEPAKVCVTLNKDNFTTSIVEKSGVFNVGVLLDEVSMDVIKRFGFQSSKDVNKFDGIENNQDVNNVKQISEGIASSFSCKVVDKFDVGTHIMFIGEVIDCKVVSEKPVLTYANYHNKKNGVTPKNSPSYVKETNKDGYRCPICGYILEASQLPADFICPICGQPAVAFEKI